VDTLTSGPGATGAATGPAERLLAQVAERINGRATVEAAFGPPCTVGDRTVIPVARIFYAFGGGGGSGTGPAGAAESPLGSGSGSGGGGGAGVRVVPVAVIEVTPERTRVRPIVDVATLATRVFVFAGVVAALGLILRRRPGRS
jgi:uncharacterized spore protein YtfJ